MIISQYGMWYYKNEVLFARNSLFGGIDLIHDVRWVITTKTARQNAENCT